MDEPNFQTKIVRELADGPMTTNKLMKLCYPKEIHNKKEIYNKFNKLISDIKKKGFIKRLPKSRLDYGHFSESQYELDYEGIYNYLLLQYIAPAIIQTNLREGLLKNKEILFENEKSNLPKAVEMLYAQYHSLMLEKEYVEKSQKRLSRNKIKEIEKRHKKVKIHENGLTKAATLLMVQLNCDIGLTPEITSMFQNFIKKNDFFIKKVNNRKNLDLNLFHYLELFILNVASSIKKEIVKENNNILQKLNTKTKNGTFLLGCYYYAHCKHTTLEEEIINLHLLQ